jgi:hypothetical protein
MSSNKISAVFLSLLIIFIISSNVIWLRSDNTPQRWDESIHLSAASGFASVVREHPLRIFVDFLERESYYPPLVPFVGAVFGLFGMEADNYTFSISIYIALLIIFTFLYTRSRFGNMAAFAASTLIMAYPIIYHESHYFMFDIPLTSFFMMSMYLMLKTDKLQNRLYTALLGLSCGLGMLIKWTFFIYAAAPLVFLIVESYKAGSDTKKAGKNITAAVIIFAVTALPWYLYNGFSIVLNIFKYAFERGMTENLPAIFTWDGLTYYFHMLPGLMTWTFLSLFIAGACLIAASKENRKELVFFLVPFAVFMLLHNKKDRYIMPVLPLAAVISAYIIYSINRIRLRTAAACVMVAAALLNFTFAVNNMPFNWPLSARPSAGDWHIKDFLSRVKPGSTLAVVPDAGYMNNVGYSFYAGSFYKDIKISGIFNFPMFTDYFLVKTGDIGPVFSGADKRTGILNAALDPKSRVLGLFEKIYEAPLPDNSTGMLYKRREKPSVDADEYRAGMNSNVMSMIAMYLKDVKKLSFRMSFEGLKADEIKVSFAEGLAGDFKHKDKGLIIRNASIDVRGLEADPFELQNGKLQMLSLDKVEINSLEVSADDLRDFIMLYAKKVADMKVTFEGGLINISAKYSKIPVSISLKLYNPAPGTDGSDICFSVKKLKAGFVPLPCGLINFVLKGYNPLLNKSNSPIKIKFGQITAENDRLIISDKI